MQTALVAGDRVHPAPEAARACTAMPHSDSQATNFGLSWKPVIRPLPLQPDLEPQKEWDSKCK